MADGGSGQPRDLRGGSHPVGSVDRVLGHGEAVDHESVQDDAALDEAVADLVSAVWGEVLELDQVDPDDGFFALGGSSMNAVRVCLRIGALLSARVAVRTLFEHPVLQDFAAALGEQLDESHRAVLLAAHADSLVSGDVPAQSDLVGQGQQGNA